MSVSHVMVAAHLKKFQTNWDNGVPYHFTVPEKVNALKDLVTRCAVPLDYGLPTCGTAYLRLNVIVKELPNKETWQYSGGALIQPSIDVAINEALVKATTDSKVVKSHTLTAYVLNEWGRYSVVFELVITVGLK